MTVRLGWTDCHTFVSYLYDSEAWVDRLPYIFLLSSGVSNVCHIACVWSTFLKLGLIPLADEIKWKLMSSPHFGIRPTVYWCAVISQMYGFLKPVQFTSFQ